MAPPSRGQRRTDGEYTRSASASWLFSGWKHQYSCEEGAECHTHQEEHGCDCSQAAAASPSLFELSVSTRMEERGHGRSARKAIVLCGVLASCMAILAISADWSSNHGHSTRRIALEGSQGIPLVGQNSFVLNVPSDSSSEPLNMPSWKELKDGDPLATRSSVSSIGISARHQRTSTSSSVSSYTESRSDGSSSFSDAGQSNGSSEGKQSGASYDGFLKALMPEGGSAAPKQDRESGTERYAETSERTGDDESSPTQDGEDGEGHDSDSGHRSATVVVHRLSSEFDRRFHEGAGAYDFCVRDTLTHEELAECIKHMLMKSSPGYKPASDQALLDKISVLRLQIREEQTQSAREIRRLHDRIQELHTRLLTAVPYSEFKQLREEYEQKLRALQRLVVRFTRDMAVESAGDKYEDTANEVAAALRDRVQSSEDDEKDKALWRILNRRIQQQREGEEHQKEERSESDDDGDDDDDDDDDDTDSGDNERDVSEHDESARDDSRDQEVRRDDRGGDAKECCRKPEVNIPRLLPFAERRAYLERKRRGGDAASRNENRGDAQRSVREATQRGGDEESRGTRRDQSYQGDGGGGGDDDDDAGLSPREKAVHRLSRSFDERIRRGGRGGGEAVEATEAEPEVVRGGSSAGEGKGKRASKDPDAVAQSAAQHTHAALDAIKSSVEVKQLPKLPSLQPLHLPASLGG